MTVAHVLAEGRRHRSCRTHHRDRILTVVMDEHTVIPMNEGMLDTWWHELDPELKAEIYEAALDSELQYLEADLGPLIKSALQSESEVAPK